MAISFDNSPVLNNIGTRDGTVTSITAGTGLTGGTITTSGTLAREALSPSPAGTYTKSNLTVDSSGRVTAASNGAADQLVVQLGSSSTDQYSTLTLQMTGANGSGIFTDDGYYGMNITKLTSNNVNLPTTTISTTQSKWGNGSGHFYNNYLSVASTNGHFAVGTADFTVEAWIYMENNLYFSPDPRFSTVIFDTRVNSSAPGLICAVGADLKLTFYDAATVYRSSATVSLNNWYHVCYMRKNNVLYTFINGVVDTVTVVSNANLSSDGCYLGASVDNSFSVLQFQGYMNDFRFSNGLARYSTSGFSAPTGPVAGARIYDLPASPSVGQMALDANNLYVCTNASGPIWKKVSIS